MNTHEKLSSAASGSSTLALRAIDISVSFGAFRALGNVDIAFDTGKVTALIGPNGAGKTTLMNVLSGLQKPSRGRVQLLGQDVTSLPAWKRARCGLMRSFQLVSVVPSFSVAGNVQLALLRRRAPSPVWWRGCEGYRDVAEQVDQHLEAHGLQDARDRLAGTLSHGEQRALDLALSVVGNPPVLLLDEPLAGVGHAEYDAFLARIRTLCIGRTVVLVEHNMDAVMTLADRLVCLVAGEVLAAGPPTAVRADARVQESYLGSADEVVRA